MDIYLLPLRVEREQNANDMIALTLSGSAVTLKPSVGVRKQKEIGGLRPREFHTTTSTYDLCRDTKVTKPEPVFEDIAFVEYVHDSPGRPLKQCIKRTVWECHAATSVVSSPRPEPPNEQQVDPLL